MEAMKIGVVPAKAGRRAVGDEESCGALKIPKARFLPLAALGVGMTRHNRFSYRLIGPAGSDAWGVAFGAPSLHPRFAPAAV